MKTDVIIIGAGPTGLSLACQFVRYGIDFVIVEKKGGVTPFSKALAVHARTLEVYEQFGLAEKAVAQGAIAEKARFVVGGEIRGEADFSDIGHGLSSYPYVLILEQSKNEQLLYEYLQAHGKVVHWQTEFESLSNNETGVTANIKTADGEMHTIEANYLVGCDGPKSPTRHALGLAFEGSTLERLFYVADVEIDWEFSHDALHGCLSQNSFVLFFPMQGEKSYRIVGVFPEGLEKDEGDILYEEIEERIKQESEIALDITKVKWFSTYKVHTRHVEKFSEGRCFLAGDSAHVHTPAGGQGMNTGIQDAYNLAWKLAFVLQKKADAKILETYNEERLENAKNLLRTTDRMFNLTAGLNWLVNLIRTIIFPPLAKYVFKIDALKKRLFPLISQIGINYRDFSLSEHIGDGKFAVKAGDRMPYFLVDGASVYDKLREPKFHLVIFSDGQSDYQTTKAELENEFAESVDFNVISLYPQIAEIFGVEKPFAILLRPDNYIGTISADTSPETVKNYFNQIVFRSAALI